MDKVEILLLLCFATFCTDALQLTISGPKKNMVRSGDPISFTCHVDQGLGLTIKNTIQWRHLPLYPPAPKDNREPDGKLLTDMGSLKNAAPPDLYDIDFAYNNTDIRVTLTIKKVTLAMDGYFICKVATRELGATDEQPMEKVELVVVSDVQAIAMTFDGEGAVTGPDPNHVEREEGEYGVTCQAAGFSPTATLRMFIGDEELPTGGADIKLDKPASQAAKARRYTARTTATAVQLKAGHTNKILKCVAGADIPGSSQMEASVPLTIIALEPVIECEDNVTARERDLYVKLSCIVDHSNVEVDRYSFEIGETGEIIKPDELSDSHDEVKVENLGNHRTKVTLDLYEVKGWHFKTYYYLDVVTKSGQKFRETVVLNESPPIGGASLLTVSQPLLLAVVLLLSSLLFSL